MAAPCARLQHLALAIPFLLAVGCVSVEPLAGDVPPELAPNQGLLVLHVDSEVEIRRLVFNGSVPLVKELPPGKHLMLFVVTAGDHRWSEIVLPGAEAWGGMRYRLGGDDARRFRVEAGRTNYPGQFFLHGEVHKRYVALGARMANRSALALEALFERYPETLRRYPPVYGGPDRDDFLDFYASQLMDREGPPAR